MVSWHQIVLRGAKSCGISDCGSLTVCFFTAPPTKVAQPHFKPWARTFGIELKDEDIYNLGNQTRYFHIINVQSSADATFGVWVSDDQGFFCDATIPDWVLGR